MLDFHAFALPVRQGLLDLIEALDVDDTTGGPGGSDDGVGQTVENAADVQHDLNHRQKSVVKELGERVEVRVVKIDPSDARG